MCNRNENKINPKNIITTVGGRFAIFCTFCSMLHPGDEVIIIEPAWPAYKDCANYLGVKTKLIEYLLGAELGSRYYLQLRIR